MKSKGIRVIMAKAKAQMHFQRGVTSMSTENAYQETKQIDSFLASPENYEIRECYQSVVDEFQLQIVSKRKDYQRFDEVMQYLVRLLFARDPILNQRKHQRLTRAMIFYMYWSCDIGTSCDATTE